MRKGLPMCPRGTGQACCFQCCVSERSNRSNRVSRPQQTSWTRCPHTQRVLPAGNQQRRPLLLPCGEHGHSAAPQTRPSTVSNSRRPLHPFPTPPALLPTSSSSLRPCPWEPVIPALRRALGSPGLQCCSPHCLFRVYRWNS